jgi:SAM-dependent methyltransferase
MLYYIISICLSAFLLILVEPMIGKTLLPWFGGTPAVWSTVMLFFQVLLTGGYAYAAWLSHRTRTRGILHLALLGLSLALLLGLGLVWKSPLTPSAALKPGGAIPPILDIFMLLSITVGLPFFLLASNSSLVQAWFSRTFTDQTPYHLYSLSNLSSLVALVSYPFLVEPNLSLPGQGWLWMGGYLLFAGLAAFTTLRAMRSSPATHAETATAIPKPSARDALLWVALSACPSILFLATTSYLTQQVAVIPFLWVLPLAIYILTFALAFSGERWYSRQQFIFLLLPSLLLYDWAMANGSLLGIPWQVAIFNLLLFITCMISHGEMYRLRPHPQHLTTFYLMVSAGGALGGILVAFVAPALFKGFWELPLGILLFSLLFLGIGRGAKPVGMKAEILSRISFVVLAVSVLITGVRAFLLIGSDLSGSIRSQRNFYGVVRIRQIGAPGDPNYAYQLIHGNTVHGAQFLGPGERDIPTVYYGPHSGVGLALLNHPRPAFGLHIGALGLGVGTIAAYGQPGDLYRFYEINPLVIQLAQGQAGYFSYLKNTQAKVEIVPGDARLSLESELTAGQPPAYDVLVLDVFSNDAIPVHLLDEQAFALYIQFLRPEGVLAVHITNGYLDLLPVVWGLADHFKLERVVIEDPGDGHFTSASTWVLLAWDPSVLAVPSIANRAKPMDGYTTSLRLWTDEYSNLFQILRH